MCTYWVSVPHAIAAKPLGPTLPQAVPGQRERGALTLVKQCIHFMYTYMCIQHTLYRPVHYCYTYTYMYSRDQRIIPMSYPYYDRRPQLHMYGNKK